MKDIRSILRLTHESGLSVREVSERLGLSKSTVSTYCDFFLRSQARSVANIWTDLINSKVPIHTDLDSQLA